MCISVQINAFFFDFFLLRMNQSKESASQSAHKIQKLTSKVLRFIFVNSPFLLLLLSTMKLSLIMNVSVIFVVSILFLMSVHPGVEANTTAGNKSLRTLMLNDRKPCENLASFGYDGNSLMTCDSYVAEKPKRRCKKEQPGTNKKLRFFCPSTCKTKCGTCENSASFRYKGNSSRTCESYVAEKPKKRCRKKQPGTKKKLRFFCPSTCKRSCKHTDSPSQSPIFDYDMTSPPTISRRDSPVFFPTNSPITDHDDFIRTPRPSMSQRDSPDFFPSNTPISIQYSAAPVRTPMPTKSDSPDFFPTNSPITDEDMFEAPVRTPRPSMSQRDSPDFSPSNTPISIQYSAAPVRTPRTPMPTKSDSPDFSPSNTPISIQYSAAPVRTPRTPMPTKSDSPDFSPSNTPISIQFEVLAPVRTPRTPIPTKSADSPPSQSPNFV